MNEPYLMVGDSSSAQARGFDIIQLLYLTVFIRQARGRAVFGDFSVSLSLGKPNRFLPKIMI